MTAHSFDFAMASDSDLLAFAASEIVRVRKLLKDTPSELSVNDALMFVPSTPGKGVEIVGEKGAKALREFALRRLSSDPYLAHRCSNAAADSAARQFFIPVLGSVECNDLDWVGFVDIYSSRIVEELKTTLKDHIFTFPCNLPTSQDNECFRIGLVQFTRSADWLSGNDGRFRWENEHADAQHDLSQFPWVASIAVHNFEMGKAQRVAAWCVDVALHIIQMLAVGYGSASQVELYTRAGSRAQPLSWHHYHESEGSIYRSWSKSFLSGPRNFVHFLQRNELWIEELASCMVPYLRGSSPKAFTEQFCDALHWFGEAAVEDRPGTKLVKSMMCLERLVVFGNERSSKGRIANRVASVLVRHLGDPRAPSRISEEIQDVYRIRSDLMHGSVGPRQAGLTRNSEIALTFAAKALLGHAALIGSIPRNERNCNEIKNAYKRLVRSTVSPKTDHPGI